MKFWEAMKSLEEGKTVRCVKGCCDKYPISINENPYSHLVELTKCEWELYEEPVQTYTFQKMIDNIQMGKKSRRKSWDQCVYSVIWVGWPRTDHGLKDERCFTLADINATDWIVVE